MEQNNLTQLKNLAKTVTGETEIPGDTIADVLNFINSNYSGGGGVGQAGTGEGAEIFNDYTDNVASGIYSHAEGYGNNATGHYSHAEGYGNNATGLYSHAEGGGYSQDPEFDFGTTASGTSSHAEGYGSKAEGNYSHAEGGYTTASGDNSHAEGSNTDALGKASHAEGSGTIATGNGSHAQGKYNIEDTEEKYAHIVGNGTNHYARSNAHTIDWDGNGWFAGTIEGANGVLLTSPNGTKYTLSVSDDGTLSATVVTE